MRLDRVRCHIALQSSFERGSTTAARHSGCTTGFWYECYCLQASTADLPTAQRALRLGDFRRPVCTKACTQHLHSEARSNQTQNVCCAPVQASRCASSGTAGSQPKAAEGDVGLQEGGDSEFSHHESSRLVGDFRGRFR